MATMRLFKPSNDCYENSYSYQSVYAKPQYSYGQNRTQQYSESQFQNQTSAFAPASHASSAMMQQSSYTNVNSSGLAPAYGGFPMKPVEQHSLSHAYSQHGSSYGMGHQSALGSAHGSSYGMGHQSALGSGQHGSSYGMGHQSALGSVEHGSYGMRRQGGLKHGAYSSAQHGSFGSAHTGLIEPVQQSFASSQSQHSSYSSGAHSLGHQGSFSSGQHASFGPAFHTPANFAMKRRQKSSYWRRSSSGFRSGDSSDSEEEDEDEEESENEHIHH